MPAGRPCLPRACCRCAAPTLRRRGPALGAPADLAAHTLIDQANTHHAAGMPTEWQTWLQSVGLPDLEPASTISFNSYSEAIGAALAGHGVALGRRPLVNALLRERAAGGPLSAASARRSGATCCW